MGSFVYQAFQVLGAFLILIAFALAQRGQWHQKSAPYLWLNFIGSGILAVEAASKLDWGFIILETVWAWISLASLWGNRRAAAQGS